MRHILLLTAICAGPALAQTPARPAVPSAPTTVPATPVVPARPERGVRPLSPSRLEMRELDVLRDLDVMPIVTEAATMVRDVEPMLAAAHLAMVDATPALVALDGELLASRVDVAGLEDARIALDAARVTLGHDLAIGFGARASGGSSAPVLRDVVRAAWLPNDQADSTYREAREALNREQYQRASDLFRQIYTKTPRSGYAADALYWDAFALYRAGGNARLREAVTLLDRQAREFPNAETRSSGAQLATRIRGQLAQAGDANATRSIQTQATTTSATCENDDVRIAAINALSQMDAERALPIVRRVLARRDECSAQLREKAVYVVSQHHPADADQILLDVVRNDPASRVRRQAVYYLGQTRSERAIAALEELVRNSEDREVQERALYSLAENAGARANEILRGVAERESASENIRSKAIYYLRERRTGDNAAYLRALYPRLTNARLREQVLNSVGEMGGEENQRWLMTIAMDTTESSRVRGAAVYRLTEGRNATTADLSALYDRMRGREMRERVLYYIAQRRDTAATAKLAEVLRSDAERQVREKALYYLSQREDAGAIDRVIAVAKTDQDREMRRKAVYYLGQSRDPRALQALQEIISQ